MDVQGTVEPGWEAVADAFRANFEAGDEVGASAHVTLGGKPVVDIWGGDAAEGGAPWAQDTIVNVYSTTKTMTAIAAMMCVDRGLFDPADPVAKHWPEFAANGKGGVTIAHLLSHSAGLPGFDEPIAPEDLYDWDACATKLAAMAPWWEPGTASGYHAVTQGNLVGEVVRRVSGKSLGTFVREEMAEPLGADFHIGFGPEHDDRCGELVPPPNGLADRMDDDVDVDSVAVRGLSSVPLTALEPRTRDWRAAEIPAAGGFGNARSVGRIHSAIACGGEVDGVRLMSAETVERILEEQTDGTDLVLGTPIRFGLGFGLPSEMLPLPSPRSFFWGGWGGSLALIDLDQQLTISYVMNKMAPELMGDNRALNVAMGAYGALMTQG